MEDAIITAGVLSQSLPSSTCHSPVLEREFSSMSGIRDKGLGNCSYDLVSISAEGSGDVVIKGPASRVIFLVVVPICYMISGK